MVQGTKWTDEKNVEKEQKKPKKKDLDRLKSWFLGQKRDLPWREQASPYAVWISEVMLQQTQVSVVIPYFERWMRRFPTISHLANASLEEVLKEWEGLGYYSRARYLHEGARHILEKFNGELPSSEVSLKAIKGLGPYTRGAILSFAFHQRKAAVDSNVFRVLSRYYCFEENIQKASSIKKIHSLAEELLPLDEPWIIAEALIELGATLCTKVPKCLCCPLKNSCQAYLQDKTALLPNKSARPLATSLHRAVAVILNQGCLLMRMGEKGKIMSDLCEFPYFEMEQAPLDGSTVVKCLSTYLPIAVFWQKELDQVQHSFTRFRAWLYPHFFTASYLENIKGYQWIRVDDLKKLPFSSGHRRIFANFQTQLRGMHGGL